MRRICERSVLVKARGKSDETILPPRSVGDSVLGGCLLWYFFRRFLSSNSDHKPPWKTPCLYDLVGIYKPWYGFKKNKTIYACLEERIGPNRSTNVYRLI